MASGRRPGPLPPERNPEKVKDGTLCQQASPRPGPVGRENSFESALESAYNSLAGGIGSYASFGSHASLGVHAGVFLIDLDRALVARYGNEAIMAAQMFL